jgi:hypothetical protein
VTDVCIHIHSTAQLHDDLSVDRDPLGANTDDERAPIAQPMTASAAAPSELTVTGSSTLELLRNG